MKKFFLVLLSIFFAMSVNAENIFFSKGSVNKKEIALTFDDGPGSNTVEILKILKDKNIKATFFLLGESAAKRPKLVKEIYEQGHEIANHTYSHINFFKYKEEDKEMKIKDELLKCEDLIKSITGYKTNLVRFPYGFSRDLAINAAEENGYKIVNWSFGMDWDKSFSQEELLKKYSENIESGAILLMHDLPKNDKITFILPKLIDEIKNRKYKLVKISELLEIK